jgi:hypothetical protein
MRVWIVLGYVCVVLEQEEGQNPYVGRLENDLTAVVWIGRKTIRKDKRCAANVVLVVLVVLVVVLVVVVAVQLAYPTFNTVARNRAGIITKNLQ